MKKLLPLSLAGSVACILAPSCAVRGDGKKRPPVSQGP